MSKKLLEESTVRSFMKLANLQPLTNNFMKESWGKQGSLEEGELEEEESLEEEIVEEEGEVQEESRLASKKQAPKSKSLTPQATQGVDGAKTVKSPGAFKALKTSDSNNVKKVSLTHMSKTPVKNNTVFDKIHESLDEMEMGEEDPQSPDMGGEVPEVGGEMGSAGESGDHQQKMKDLIRGMLDTLKNMGEEYGMSMEISDEGGSPESPEAGAEMGPPEGEEPQGQEAMMQEKLDEIVEKLTRRVTSRLTKQAKKKR